MVKDKLSFNYITLPWTLQNITDYHVVLELVFNPGN